MSPELVAKHREMLLAQCPVPPAPLSPEDAARLPINVKTCGADGPAVLIVHGGVQGGIGGGPITFAAQEPLAERGWKLLLVERPGFGDSPSRGLDDMEAEAVWISDMLGDGAHLIGHSWGGADALLAAARRPAAVRSLTLVEPALFPLLMTDPKIMADPDKRAAAMRVAQLMLSSQTPAEYGLAFAASLGSDDEAGGSPNVALAALQGDPAKAAKLGCALLQGRMASPESMRAAVEKVVAAKLPVLVISGGWSPFFDIIGEAVAGMTHGRHEVVKAPNHFPQMANPADFNELVDAFMRGAERTMSS